jgi:hypothetical protein
MSHDNMTTIAQLDKRLAKTTDKPASRYRKICIVHSLVQENLRGNAQYMDRGAKGRILLRQSTAPLRKLMRKYGRNPVMLLRELPKLSENDQYRLTQAAERRTDRTARMITAYRRDEERFHSGEWTPIVTTTHVNQTVAGLWADKLIAVEVAQNFPFNLRVMEKTMYHIAYYQSRSDFLRGVPTIRVMKDFMQHYLGDDYPEEDILLFANLYYRWRQQ